MKEILLCWLGFADLKASANVEGVGLGPIGQAATELSFEEIVLISDQPNSENKCYIEWLKTKNYANIILQKLIG